MLGRRAGNGEITILDKKAFPTGRRPYSEVLDEFFATVEEILSAQGVKVSQVVAFGISCGGPLDSKRGGHHVSAEPAGDGTMFRSCACSKSVSV